MTSYDSWYRGCVGNVAKVISGYAFKSKEFQDEGIPVIKIKNIRVGYVDLSDVQYVDEKYLELNEKYHVRGGELLISLTGSHLTQPDSVVGRVALHSTRRQQCLLNQRAGKIIITAPDKCDSRFLFYTLVSKDYSRAIALMAHGAASQANISPSQVESLEIPLPPLPTQQKIADILSAYDDLIENNARRIKILEEMAQLIYQAWFVNFRFPGHEQVKMVDSELGKIPEGWKVRNLGKLTSVITKGTTPTTFGKKFSDKGINFFKVESIDSNGFILEKKLAKIDDETYNIMRRSQIKTGDILFSIAGAIGRATLIPETILPANTNQALAIIRPLETILTLYLYRSIRSREFVNFSLGRVVQTAQANVSLSVLSAAPILVPDRQLLQKFHNISQPFMKNANLLQQKNANLLHTRDLLLPKLISGEIDVEELDIETGAEADVAWQQ